MLNPKRRGYYEGHIAHNTLPSKKRLTGRDLAAWTGRASMLTKLCVGAALADGEVEVSNPTVTQVARMLGLKSRQLRSIAQLPPEQRAALTAQRLSNEMLDRIVDSVGANRLWAALDRATAPTRVAAE
jgi:hypothetical protein